jgi:CheY-like chemotaxis protein
VNIEPPPILVAEDDPDDVFMLRRAFAKSDVANPLVFVSDGDEAIEYLSGSGRYANVDHHPVPAALLLDLKMPRRNGFEVLEWLRDHAGLGHLPVVVLTSSRESADVTRAYELGANSYLVKPGSPEDLLATVRGLGLYWLVLNEAPEVER